MPKPAENFEGGAYVCPIINYENIVSSLMLMQHLLFPLMTVLS